jgi:aminomethyltransferase
MDSSDAPIRQTTLHDWHVAAGAKMVPFAGYDMPVHYRDGIIKEHLHTRSEAGLFDVSHMGHIVLRGHEAWKNFARLVPSDVMGLKPFHMRYTMLMNDFGCAIDDLMMVRPDDSEIMWLIVNASRKEADLKFIQKAVGKEHAMAEQRDLIALQGPNAVEILRHHAPGTAELGFMQASWMDLHDIPAFIMRSGYTGEDGFEISVLPSHTLELVNLLMQHPEVKPIGLGARDTLRLEAGLCLYGHELDEKTTPVEAGLNWVISRPRMSNDEFNGASILEAETLNSPERKRVGLEIEGRAPAREGTEIQDSDGKRIGHVTSGSFSPTLNRPIAMGYVERSYAKIDTEVNLIVRGKPIKATTRALPFVYHRYAIKKK